MIKIATRRAKPIVSTAIPPTATVNAMGEDVRVAALIAEYAPYARAKAEKDRADAKARSDKVRTDMEAQITRIKAESKK